MTFKSNKITKITVSNTCNSKIRKLYWLNIQRVSMYLWFWWNNGIKRWSNVNKGNFGTDICSNGYFTFIRYICNIPVNIWKLYIARGYLNFHSTNFEYYEVNKCAPPYQTKCLHGLKYVYICEYGYFSSCTKRLNIIG